MPTNDTTGGWLRQFLASTPTANVGEFRSIGHGARLKRLARRQSPEKVKTGTIRTKPPKSHVKTGKTVLFFFPFLVNKDTFLLVLGGLLCLVVSCCSRMFHKFDFVVWDPKRLQWKQSRIHGCCIHSTFKLLLEDYDLWLPIYVSSLYAAHSTCYLLFSYNILLFYHHHNFIFNWFLLFSSCNLHFFHDTIVTKCYGLLLWIYLFIYF